MRRKTAKGVVSSLSISTSKDKGKLKTNQTADKKQKLSEEAKKESLGKSAESERNTTKRKRSSDVDTLDKDIGLPPMKQKNDSTCTSDIQM